MPKKTRNWDQPQYTRPRVYAWTYPSHSQFRRRATLIRLTLHKSDAVERDGKLQGYARQGLRQIGQWDLASQDSTEPWELPSPLPFTWRRLTVAPQSLHNPV